MSNLGRYQVLAPLAKVGGDEVFLAQTLDARGADYHVVRRIGDGTVEDARRAAWLRHPNLVSIRELGACDGGWFVATEYVHGEDLARVLARVRRADDQVPIALVTAIGAAAAAGLHHAHTHSGSRRTRRRGSVHGGVTPARIVVGYDGSVKVAGLGVGAAIDAAYLAPEQAASPPRGIDERSEAARGGDPTGVPVGRGRSPRAIDARTDVFALGVVLYELATSRRLFRAPSDYLTRAAIAEPNIPAPSRFRRGLPRALENIILKALAPAPEDRFRSAGELREALERFARRVGMRQTPAGIADYLRGLFGAPRPPWLSGGRTGAAAGGREETIELADGLADEADDEQLGVAAPPEAVLRELGVPEARELEMTPGRGTKTPMSWTTQAAPPRPPRSPRSGRGAALLAGAAVAAAIASFLAVGAIRRGGPGGPGDPGDPGDSDAVVPASAPLPPPPPPASAPAKPMVTPLPEPPPPGPPAPAAMPPPDAISGDGSAGPTPVFGPDAGANAKPAETRPQQPAPRSGSRRRASQLQPRRVS